MSFTNTNTRKNKKEVKIAEEPEPEQEVLEEVEDLDEVEAKNNSTDEEIDKMTTENKKSKKVDFLCEDVGENTEILNKLDMDIENQIKYRKVVFKNLLTL